MRIELDKAVDVAMGWDLVLRIGGVDYATRCPMMAEVLALTAVNQGNVSAAMETLKGLFTDKCPPLETLPPEYMGAVIAAFSAYLKGRTEKNSLAVSGQIARMMASDSTRGN